MVQLTRSLLLQEEEEEHLALEGGGLILIGGLSVSAVLIPILMSVFVGLAGIDVDKIAQTIDVQILQQNILHVTFCNVSKEVRQQLMI